MDFDYGVVWGPHKWVLKYKDAGGDKQSPININTSTLIYDASLSYLDFSFNHITSQKLAVKEHNFQVSVVGKAALRVNHLPSEYILQQFHFHWGSGNTWGSEHMINGLTSPAELHMVFMNYSYLTFEEALKHEDGLAVVGVFIQVSVSLLFALSVGI